MGNGVPSLSPLEDVDETVLVWWHQGRPQTVWYTEIRGSLRVKMHEITADWKQSCFIQFLAASSDDVQEVQEMEPEIQIYTPERQIIRNPYRSPPSTRLTRSSVHSPVASIQSTQHSSPHAPPQPPGPPPRPPAPQPKSALSRSRSHGRSPLSAADISIDDVQMRDGVHWPKPRTIRWTPDVDDREKRKRSHSHPGSTASTPGRSTRPTAPIFRRLADTPSPAAGATRSQGAAAASGAYDVVSPTPSTLPYNSPHSPGVASTVGYSPQPVSPQPAPVLPALGEVDDGYEDAESELDVREYDSKDKFFIDDLNGVAALEGLDGIRSPPDPLHYCSGISAMHSSFYDIPVICNDDNPIQISISGYLRHWCTGIAEFMDVVDQQGLVVGRATGVDAIDAGRELVMRFYGNGRKEVVIEQEMNILTL